MKKGKVSERAERDEFGERKTLSHGKGWLPKAMSGSLWQEEQG